MKLPVLEEITLKNFDMITLLSRFKKMEVGNYPYCIDLTKIDKEFRRDIILRIEEALETLGVSPRFPYPVFIINDLPVEQTQLRIVRSFEELPKYFHIDSNRLRTKEQAVLGKIILLKSKISNQPVKTRLRDMKKGLKFQKELFHKTSEAFFYEQVKKIIKE